MIAFALALLMSTDPLEQFVAHTRAGLAEAGLERVQFGETVYWRSPSPGAARHPLPASRGEGLTPPVPRPAERGEGGRRPGEGPTLVLLHGVNDQAGTWSTVAPELAKHYDLIIPDLPAHGESGPTEGPVPLSLMVVRLHEILEREHATCVTLAGNSMGGWVSLLYTFAHPDRVERLILEDSSGMTWPITVPLVASDRATAMTMLRAVHGPTATIPDWTVDALLSRAGSSPMLRVGMAGVFQYLVDDKLPSLRVPTTLVWGEDDGVLPVAYAEALQKKIAGSQLLVIPGAAHIPHRQQPERFVECLSKSFSPSARD